MGVYAILLMQILLEKYSTSRYIRKAMCGDSFRDKLGRYCMAEI